MIKRIVRMEFREDRMDEFMRLFNDTYPMIRGFDGCSLLELHRDAASPNVLYTLSHWESDVHLQHYRASPLFERTWAATKALFSGKPLAYSLEQAIADRING